jgi:glycosyltransferase involved in cell wall biosynthesis
VIRTATGTDGLSCLICAYNEGARIDQILGAVSDHPLFSQIIVVDDGSTDDTASRAAAYPGITLISNDRNRGKTWSMARGIEAASGEYVMLLDADLMGVRARDLDALAAPVLNGRADVTLSLRSNSLGLYRFLHLDFVSGERVMPTAMLKAGLGRMDALPRWGGEVFFNDLIIEEGLTLDVVAWKNVRHALKSEKVGAWQGLLDEGRMLSSAFKALSLAGMIRQNWLMLGLKPARRHVPLLTRAARLWSQARLRGLSAR